MLNIKEKESENVVEIVGILSELDITDGTSKGTGKDYISATAKIRLDQDINGVMTENLIPVRMFAMKLKKDGTPNKAYERIKGYRDTLTSLAVAENPSQASRVRVTGCKLEENTYMRNDGTLSEKNFSINASFINNARDTDTDKATFEIKGAVVGKMMNEVNSNNEDTGNLIVEAIIIGYNGKANVIKMIASGPAKAHIEENWSEGDTVNVNGVINMYSQVQVTYEEQGFGPKLERRNVKFRQDLVILGGSGTGLDESYSYDSSDVKVALSDRKAALEALKNKPATTAPTKGKANPGFDF